MGNQAGKQIGDCCDSRGVGKLEEAFMMRDQGCEHARAGAGGAGLILGLVRGGEDEGLLCIRQIVPQGAADRQASLKPGDVIIKMDGIRSSVFFHVTNCGTAPSPLVGSIGSVVHLMVRRRATNELFIAAIRRMPISLPEEHVLDLSYDAAAPAPKPYDRDVSFMNMRGSFHSNPSAETQVPSVQYQQPTLRPLSAFNSHQRSKPTKLNGNAPPTQPPAPTPDLYNRQKQALAAAQARSKALVDPPPAVTSKSWGEAAVLEEAPGLDASRGRSRGERPAGHPLFLDRHNNLPRAQPPRSASSHDSCSQSVRSAARDSRESVADVARSAREQQHGQQKQQQAAPRERVWRDVPPRQLRDASAPAEPSPGRRRYRPDGGARTPPGSQPPSARAHGAGRRVSSGASDEAGRRAYPRPSRAAADGGEATRESWGDGLEGMSARAADYYNTLPLGGDSGLEGPASSSSNGSALTARSDRSRRSSGHSVSWMDQPGTARSGASSSGATNASSSWHEAPSSLRSDRSCGSTNASANLSRTDLPGSARRDAAVRSSLVEVCSSLAERTERVDEAALLAPLSRIAGSSASSSRRNSSTSAPLLSARSSASSTGPVTVSNSPPPVLSSSLVGQEGLRAHPSRPTRKGQQAQQVTAPVKNQENHAPEVAKRGAAQGGVYSNAGLHKSLMGGVDYKNKRATMRPAKRNNNAFPLRALNHNLDSYSRPLSARSAGSNARELVASKHDEYQLSSRGSRDHVQPSNVQQPSQAETAEPPLLTRETTGTVVKRDAAGRVVRSPTYVGISRRGSSSGFRSYAMDKIFTATVESLNSSLNSVGSGAGSGGSTPCSRVLDITNAHDCEQFDDFASQGLLMA